jgi:Zn-dependent protease with chaperone function
MSEYTLEKMDEEYLYASKLSARQERLIQAHFNNLSNGDRRYKLHFRSAPQMGANAFALPSGDVVLTDQLVALSRDDEFRDILGVLAHEKGHVVKKHSLRMAIKTGMAGAVIGYITGDISILASTIPTILINSSYSREFEHEADVYAISELKRLNISPKYIVHLFEVLEKKNENSDKNSTDVDIFSSHPLTEERIKFFNSYVKK